jgi:hypothetical protein
MGKMGDLGIYVLINYLLKEEKNKLLSLQTNINNTITPNVLLGA